LGEEGPGRRGMRGSTEIRRQHVFAAAAAVFLLIMPVGRPQAMECLPSQVQGSIAPAGVDQPSDIAIGPKGRIFLVDGVNNRVVVTDAGGTPQFTFGRAGGGMGELRYPMGIDISRKGQIFIADTGNHRVAVFDLEGGFLYAFPVKAAAGEKPAAPVDVLALDRKNYLYVADKDNHKIKVHKQKGAFVFEWGGFGEERGRFRYPGILAANPYNQVFVVDVLNTRVQVFDPDGNFLTEISTWGVSPGRLFRPKGVAVDKSDRVFISDSFMGCVQAFTDLGGFLGVVCAGGTKRSFTTPVGIVFDADNRLLVVEMRANRVSIVKVAPRLHKKDGQ
jgi:tripartite motif-containing protein 71